MSNLVIGCGYLGNRVAARWRNAGEEVCALTRSPARAELLAREGIVPIVGDVMSPPSLAGLPAARTILFALGYDRHGGHDKRAVYVEGLQNVLAALPAVDAKLIYTSSSSVYGQTDGSSVDEDSPCIPQTEAGEICLAAENALREHPWWGPRSIILRLVGLYGPGRVPHQAKLAAGEPLAVVAEGYLNLIHVDDAAAAVLAAAAQPVQHRLFCISDGHPVVRRDYYAEIARLIGSAPPHFVPPPAGAPVAERGRSDKHVLNDRMRRELMVEPAYPSYREGLQAILQS